MLLNISFEPLTRSIRENMIALLTDALGAQNHKKNIPTIYVPDFLFATIRKEYKRKFKSASKRISFLYGRIRNAFFLKYTTYF